MSHKSYCNYPNDPCDCGESGASRVEKDYKKELSDAGSSNKERDRVHKKYKKKYGNSKPRR